MTTPILLQKKRPQLLLKCLLLSVAAHVVIGGYLYYNPMILQSPLQSLFGITIAESKPLPHESELDFINKNLLLEEVFKTLLVMPSQLHPPYDLDEMPQGIALAPQEETLQIEPLTLEDPSSFNALIDKKILSKEAILKEIKEVSPSPLFLELERDAKIASHLQIDEMVASIEIPFVEPMDEIVYEDITSLTEMPSSVLYEKEDENGLLYKEMPIEVGKRSKSTSTKVHMQKQLLSPVEKKPSLFVPKAHSSPVETRLVELGKKSHFEQYTLPQLPPSALWNEDFSMDVSYAPNPEGSGYLFSLTLNPLKDLSQHKLKQNFYFILDRSSSSKQHRFSVFKRATMKALSSIQPEDTFNILILDKHVTKFSPNNLAASLKNKRAAEEFLDTQDSNLPFNNGNIYSTLKKVLSSIPSDAEMHTAILLTDGQSGMNIKKKRNVLNEWIRENQDRVTLHTAAVGKENDLLTLDLLSTESGGKLLYSDTHASFPRKLAKLILDLKHPLAKQIDVSIKPHQSHSYIELYPTSSSLPPLYANEPYVILGHINSLASFDLILEGRHGDDWIGIKKKITFEKAKTADPQLVKQWKKTQASVCYTKFLEEGKASHLKDAKQILNLAQKEISFQ